MFPMNTVRLSSKWGKRNYILNGKKTTDFHYGIDIIGKDGGIEPIYAVDKGICIAKSTNDGVGAYYVVLQHDFPNARYLTMYWHFSSFDHNYKVGSIVEKGQVLGIEGKTGKANGNHLHFEMWICPKDYKWNIKTHLKHRKKYAVNPLEHLMLSKHQTTTENVRKELDFIEIKTDREVEVKTNSVRQRIEPSTRYLDTVKGNIPIGVYRASTSVKMPDYEWVKINDLWVALIDGHTEYKDTELETLKKENKELKKHIETLQIELGKFKKIEAYIKD